MDYQTYEPQSDLESIVNCYWTLKVPAADDHQRQRILPDGMIEMVFIFGDDIRRYLSDSESEDEFIIQPSAMVLGQIIDPFVVEPTGAVDSFAVRFYPYVFANLISVPINQLANKETPLDELFDPELVKPLEQSMKDANNAEERIAVIESFLLERLNDAKVIDKIVQSTVDALEESKGSASINDLVQDDLSKRRQLERKFSKQVGMSPKQLGKVIRLQSALKRMLNDDGESLTDIAYQSEYYDQAHFTKDFKEFTGLSPKEFADNANMELSSAFYK